MTNRLKNMRIDEVSLVDKGANQEAFVVLYKRDEMKEENKQENAEVAKNEFTNALAVAESFDDMWKLQDALRTAIKEVIDSEDDDKVSKVYEIVNSYADALKNKISTALQKRDEDANELENVKKELALVSKMSDVQKKFYDELEDVAKKDLLSKEDAIAEIEKRISEDEVVVLDGSEIRKSKVGEAAFAVIAKAVNDKAEVQKKLDEEIAKREKEARVAKAKDVFTGYACDEDVLEKAYVAFADMDEDVRKCFETIIKVGSTAINGLKEQISKNVTEEKTELTDQERVIKAIKEKNDNK